MTNTTALRDAVQDLLAERRDAVNEMRCETDPTAIAMLAAHIAVLDSEIALSRPPVTQWANPAAWGRP